MTRILALTAFVFLLTFCSYAQAPGTQWSNRIVPAGSEQEGQAIFGMVPIKSGGFLLTGCDEAQITPITSYLLNREKTGLATLSKTDIDGKILWTGSPDLTTGRGAYNSVVISKENEYVIAGFSMRYYSPPLSGIAVDLTFSRYKSDGSLVLQKTFGGSLPEFGQSIVQSADGNFVIAGSTGSTDMGVTGNHGIDGTYDFWVIKLDTSGSILWQKCFSGNADDKAYSIKETADHGFVVVGYNNPGEGNISGNKGGQDGWVVKLDSAGSLQWQKSIGGSASDEFKDVLQTPDGGYLLVGHTYSNDKDVSGNHGDADAWVVRLNALGDILWQKCFGGSAEETSISLQATLDNGYLVTGNASSSDGNVSDLHGGSDTWLFKTDLNGNLVWQKTIGTPLNDYGMAVQSISENDIFVLGMINPYVGIPGGIELQTTAWLHKLGNTAFIKGHVFIDNNRNGLKDPGEAPFSNALVKTEKPGYQRAAAPYQGFFKIDVDTGNYTTGIAVYNQPYYHVVPLAVTSALPSYFMGDSISFALQPIAGKRDLAVELIPLTPSRPGFINAYHILYTNQGTDTVGSGTIKFVKNNKLEFKSAIPALVLPVSGDTLTWTYSNLKPFDTAGIVIYCRLDSSISPLSKDTLHLTAAISPAAADLTPANNTSVLRQHVTGSFDPNDKSEKHGGSMRPDQVSSGDYLTYTIRFQNTGTNTAFTVAVRDTLDSKLNWNSLEMITASHAYRLTINDAHKCTWLFNDILLVDSNKNEPLSHGYIVYRIKPQATFHVGDTIKNTASIYFDYNLPVVTNTEQTVVETFALPLNLISFSANKKGKSNLLIWSSSSEINTADFEIERSANGRDFYAIGALKASGNNSRYSFIDKTPLSLNNYYRLKISVKDGSYNYSAVKQLSNDLSIALNVFPNPAKDLLVVQLDAPEYVSEMSIIDLNGKVVKQFSLHATGFFSKRINIANLSAGSYFVQVKTVTGYSAFKFQKQ